MVRPTTIGTERRIAQERVEARKRLDASEPRVLNASPDSQRRNLAQSVLPKGRSLYDPPRKTANMDWFSGMGGASSWSPGGGTTMFQTQRPYFPEVEDSSRQQYPHDRRRANALWRMFYRYDPVFGNAVEMYADMLVSDFDIVVPKEASPEIKETLEYMCEKCKIVEVMKQIVIEYLTIGEVFPHLFFSEELGIWNYCGFHNPDYIDVKDAPLINMDPILTYEPDERLRELLVDTSPEAQEIRKKFPTQFVQKIVARQPIRLAPTNVSFIARKMHPYDERGMSLASRLWRIWMVEDAVYRSTIETFRRNAAPLKIVKLGDPASGWIPSPEKEAQFLQMLAQCENDPAAVLVWNYGVSFEAWGTNERATTIRGELDTIEKVKMQALGISKSIMDGSSTFASQKSGLQIFLRRLLSLRQYIEQVWLMPKFFRPISEANEWIKATNDDDADPHTMRRQSSDIKAETQYIMPKLVWSNQLDPQVDSDILNAYATLEKVFGIKLSKSTVCAAVGLDFDDEHEKELAEFKDLESKDRQQLGDALKKKHDEQVAKPGAGGGAAGAPGSGAKPPGASGGAPGAGGKNQTPDASHPPGSGGEPGVGALSESVDPAGNDTMAV
jgi:hypothetical protein